MNKTEAQEQLNNLQEEVDKLKKIINSPEKDWKSVVDFESACKFNGDNSYYILNKWEKAELTNSQIAGLKLEYCIKAINENWIPNWNNSKEVKYYNWFEYYSGRFGFFGVFVVYSSRGCGSGFFYGNKEKAQHGTKHFVELYKIWMG